MFKHIFSNTYYMCFADGCPYTTYEIDFSNSNIGTIDIDSFIYVDSVNIDKIILKNFNFTHDNISSHASAGCPDICNCSNCTIKNFSIDIRDFRKYDIISPLQFNNQFFAIISSHVDTINLISNLTINGARISIRTAYEINIVIEDNGVDTYDLPFNMVITPCSDIDEYDSSKKIDTCTINITIDNMRLYRQSDDPYDHIEFAGYELERPCFFYTWNGTEPYNYIKHLIININKMKNNGITSNGAIKKVGFSDGRNITGFYELADEIDIYIDFSDYNVNSFDYTELGYSDIFNELRAGTVHLKNLPSSLQSQYTAACFDIVNVIE